jgi:hypothetical protein
VFLRVQCAYNVITHYELRTTLLTLLNIFCPQTDDSGRVSEGPSCHDRSVFAEGLAAHTGVSKY